MSNICKVLQCRYNKTHVTRGHKCGKCGMYGHGIIECTNTRYLSELHQYYNDVVPVELQCRVENCRFYMYHTIDAHNCNICKQRDPHSERNCPKNTFDIKCPICRTNNKLVGVQKKI